MNVTDKPTPELRSQAVGNAIGQQRLLLVIDDAWQLEPAQLLRCGGPHCGHLLTTRDLGLARTFAGDRQRAVSVPVLEDDPAFALLQGLAPEACAADPEAAQQLAGALGGLPLALELVGGFLAAPERSLFPELGSAALDEMADPGRRLALATVRLGTLDGRQVTLRGDNRPEPGAPAGAGSGGVLCAGRVCAQAGDLRPGRGQGGQPGGCGHPGDAGGAQPGRAGWPRDAGPPPGRGRRGRTGRCRRTPRERHRDYYLARVDEDREDWERIEGLYPQVQWAWQRQVEGGAAVEAVLAFVWALRIYQERRGLWQDKLAWASRGLEMARAAACLGEPPRCSTTSAGSTPPWATRRRRWTTTSRRCP